MTVSNYEPGSLMISLPDATTCLFSQPPVMRLICQSVFALPDQTSCHKSAKSQLFFAAQASPFVTGRDALDPATGRGALFGVRRNLL